MIKKISFNQNKHERRTILITVCTALGVALLGALVTAGYSKAINSQIDQIPANTVSEAREGIANALAVAANAGPQSAMLIRIARASFVEGWQQAMGVGAGVMAILFVYVLARGPRTVKVNDVLAHELQTV